MNASDQLKTQTNARVRTARSVTVIAFMASLTWQAEAAGPKAVRATNKAAAEQENATAFSLDDYLREVEAKHDGYRAAKSSSEAANMYVKEARVALMPTLFATMQHKEDRSPQPPSFLQFDRLQTDQLQIGVSKTTDLGLSGRLFYQWSETQYDSLNFFGSTPRNIPRFYSASPTAELTWSLWRNWMGSETKEQVAAAEAQAKLDARNSSYMTDQIRYAAEAAYWRIVFAREAVKISREALARSEELDAWTRRRATLQLADRADYLQSQAAVKRNRLDLRARENEERAASLAFNATRGRIASEVTEKLQPFTREMAANFRLPEAHGERGDVAVAREQTRIASANARLARERTRPTVELFGSYSMNALRDSASDTIGNSWTSERPVQAIGLRVNAPLEFGALSDAREGRAMQEAAAELTLRRKTLEQDQDWDDLVAKFSEAQDRLKLHEDLEDVQKQKLDYERGRQRSGRTTMQQVLLFEIDYQNAQLGRIVALNELNQLNAQMKLFGVKK